MTTTCHDGNDDDNDDYDKSMKMCSNNKIALFNISLRNCYRPIVKKKKTRRLFFNYPTYTAFLHDLNSSGEGAEVSEEEGGGRKLKKWSRDFVKHVSYNDQLQANQLTEKKKKGLFSSF